MSRIRILPDILSNKIAAGEVVERPSSAVKELVENALDAGSSRIRIEVEQGGRSLIRVADNGCGMNPDDALLALERYATSKIFSDEDLFSIRTLGFRGEALPSIAAVSKLSLVTREPSADAAVAIDVDGGRITSVQAAGAPPGTMITVRRLFFNTPARRKFMKTVATEMGHIGDTVSAMALAHHGVAFKLVHNGKIVRDWPRTQDSAQRAAAVLGRRTVDDLLALRFSSDDMQVTGWIGRPALVRRTSRNLYFFVNGRVVRDRVLQHAVTVGYAGRVMKGQFPVAVIHLSLPFDQVDVNVHPAKHEVRFAHQRRVHDDVARQVGRVLAEAERTRWGRITESKQPVDVAAPPDFSRRPTRRPDTADSKERFWRAAADAPPQIYQVAEGTPSRHDQAGSRLKAETGNDEDAGQQTLWPARRFADLAVIGQFDGTYLICQARRTLVVIDQHAAHERVVFEQLKGQSARARPQTQALLLAETIDLGHGEAAVLTRLLPALEKIGLAIEPFGGTAFAIKTVPALVDAGRAADLVMDLVQAAARTGVDAGVDDLTEDLLKVMACHHALRAHQQLDEVQIRHLLCQLDECDNPSHCPHGRPTWIQWSRKDLEKSFGRLPG